MLRPAEHPQPSELVHGSARVTLRAPLRRSVARARASRLNRQICAQVSPSHLDASLVILDALDRSDYLAHVEARPVSVRGTTLLVTGVRPRLLSACSVLESSFSTSSSPRRALVLGLSDWSRGTRPARATRLYARRGWGVGCHVRLWIRSRALIKC